MRHRVPSGNIVPPEGEQGGVTHRVHDEVQLAVVHGDIDAIHQQLVNDVHHWPHKVPGHFSEHFLRLAYTLIRGRIQ